MWNVDVYVTLFSFNSMHTCHCKQYDLYIFVVPRDYARSPKGSIVHTAIMKEGCHLAHVFMKIKGKIWCMHILLEQYFTVRTEIAALVVM